MTETADPGFEGALRALVQWLESLRVPHMVVGGVAASLLGRPRLTQDIDALVDLEKPMWARALAESAKFGLTARADDPLQLAERARVLLLRHTASQIDIDVILAELPFERNALARSEVQFAASVEVRLPNVEDLLVMKAIARRPKDLLDIAGLLDAHPKTDLTWVRAQVSEFARATAMGDILDEFERVVASVRRRT